MATHLTVLQNDGNTNAQLVVDYRTEVRWIGDYAAFAPLALRWWDDVSYAHYQASDIDFEPPKRSIVEKRGCCSVIEWVGDLEDALPNAECSFGPSSVTDLVASLHGSCKTFAEVAEDNIPF